MSALTRGVPLVVARYRDRSPVVAAALPLTAHAVRRGLTVATRTRTGSRSVGVLTTRRRALVVRASVDEATPAPKRTDTVHWSTALATAVAIAGAASPLFFLTQSVLLKVGVVLLGLSLFSFIVEAVADAMWQRKVRKTGEKEAWLAKAREVGRAARERDLTAPKAKADNWGERNVNGAATEEDAKIIRELNSFLQ